VDLDKLLPLGPQLVPTGTDVLGGAVRDPLALHPDSRNNVSLQHLLQLFLVGHQLVEGIHWNLIKSSICRSEDSEGSGTSEVLHHAGGLQGGVEGGEVLVLGDQGGHALPGLIDGSRGLGGGAGDGVDVGTAEVVGRVGSGGTDGQVVVESSDRPGVVGQHSLGGQEWVEGLNWSALQRQRSPLARCERPERFTLDRSWFAVVDLMVDRLDRFDWLDGLDKRLDGLYRWLDGVVSVLSCWLDMVGPVCGMLSMVGPMGSMGRMFSRLLGLLAMLGMLAMVFMVVMIVTISRHQREDH